MLLLLIITILREYPSSNFQKFLRLRWEGGDGANRRNVSEKPAKVLQTRLALAVHRRSVSLVGAVLMLVVVMRMRRRPGHREVDVVGRRRGGTGRRRGIVAAATAAAWSVQSRGPRRRHGRPSTTHGRHGSAGADLRFPANNISLTVVVVVVASVPVHASRPVHIGATSARLDKFWLHRDILYDYTADLTGIGDRSVRWPATGITAHSL